MSAPSTTQRSFFKDVQELYRTIESSTDGQAAIESVDDMSVRISMRPKTGCNAHATFYMSIFCSSAYPTKAPRVTFDTPIFHPNIDFVRGNVCLSIFWQWQACYNLLDLVKAILYLIDHPNFESNFFGLNEEAELAAVATKSALLLAGFPVDGQRFPPNTSWCEWARENNCLPTAEEVKEEGYVWTPPKEVDQEAPDILEYKWRDASEDNKENHTQTWSDVSSDTIPSFAKFRCSIADEDFCEGSLSISQFYRPYIPLELGMHRTVIWQPSHENSPEQKSTFYYGEVMCSRQHFEEIGFNYLDIFKGSLTFDLQVEPETRQRSKLCVWQPYYEDTYSYGSKSFSYVEKFYLTELFQDPKPPRNVTADFCPWSKEDGLGTNYLLDWLFFNKDRMGGSFTCFLDEDSENGSSDNGIVALFDSENLADFNYQEIISDEDSIAYQSDITSASQPSDVNIENDTDDVSKSSLTDQLIDSFGNCETCMRLCFTCNEQFATMFKCVNEELYPHWKLVFLQTRWPIRFAPQQSVELSTADVCVPPWRVSAGRLLHDVCHYCTQKPHLENLILLDPMSLSPLSPLCNLMQRNAAETANLTGVLWMTPFQALSPFYHLPLSSDNCPSAITMRYLTLNTYLTNWVSWISRMEVYSSLGFSRPLPKYITDSVAAHILQPFSLGCGETPFLDLCPLWLLRTILKSFLYLPTIASCFVQSFRSGGNQSNRNTQIFIPFTDMDEI